MFSVADLLMAAGGGAGTRYFSSVDYTGNGGIQSIATGVDADIGEVLTIVQERLFPASSPAHYDTVRGSFARLRPGSGEDVLGAFSFSGKNRITTGTQYNVNGTAYRMWNFARAPRFMDIVTFSGGQTNIAHILNETPKFVVVIKRSGSGGSQESYIWTPGDTVYNQGSSEVSGTLFSSYNSATFTPSSTIFPAGGNYVAYIFGTGSGNVAVGSFVGNVTEQTVGSQSVSLGSFAAGAVMLRGPIRTAAAPQGAGRSIGAYDSRPGNVNNVSYGMFCRTGVPGFSVSGTNIGASSFVSNVFPPPTYTSWCIDGETYRYFAVK